MFDKKFDIVDLILVVIFTAVIVLFVTAILWPSSSTVVDSSGGGSNISILSGGIYRLVDGDTTCYFREGGDPSCTDSVLHVILESSTGGVGGGNDTR